MYTTAYDKFSVSIEACLACAVECNRCASACLEEPDAKVLARCIQLDGDCALVCHLAADYMARKSEFAGQICELCAQICDTCAAECEKHAARHEHCRRCADACRHCAEECRTVLSLRGNA